VVALWLAFTAQGRDASGATFFTTWILLAGLITGLVFEIGFLPACKMATLSGTGWVKLLPGTAALAALRLSLFICSSNWPKAYR